VVLELTQKRIWFGAALVSSSADEVRRLIALARQWAERLGKQVELWMSDKQEAFVSGIAAEFPEVPHRYCQNHFLRDVAKPLLEEDSHAKVQMRSKVRGLRALERETLSARRTVAVPAATTPAAGREPAALPDPAAAVVLDYCTVVKGISNNDQGRPLHPPGIRMAEALMLVRQSLERNLQTKKRARGKRARTTGGLPRPWTGSRRPPVCKPFKAKFSWCKRSPTRSIPPKGTARLAKRGSTSSAISCRRTPTNGNGRWPRRCAVFNPDSLAAAMRRSWLATISIWHAGSAIRRGTSDGFTAIITPECGLCRKAAR
jgi:hypothetical protein